MSNRAYNCVIIFISVMIIIYLLTLSYISNVDTKEREKLNTILFLDKYN